MSLSPLAHPLSDKGLFQATQRLYKETLVQALPITIIIALIIYFASVDLPIMTVHQNKIAMGILFLLIPLFGVLIALVDSRAKGKSHSYKNIVELIFKKFLNYIEGLVSILLLPMLVLGLCTLVYFTMLFYHVNYTILFAWKILSIIAIFLTIFRWIFVPSLIIGDNVEPNIAGNVSAHLAALKLRRTFLAGFLCFLLMAFLVQVPQLALFYLPFLKKFGTIGQLVISLLCAVFWSWPVAFMLVQQYDLQCRKKAHEGQSDKTKIEKSPPMQTDSEKNTVSF